MIEPMTPGQARDWLASEPLMEREYQPEAKRALETIAGMNCEVRWETQVYVNGRWIGFSNSSWTLEEAKADWDHEYLRALPDDRKRIIKKTWVSKVTREEIPA